MAERALKIHYECVRCTECCRWPGQVKLNDAEIARMAAFLGVNERDFIERYTRLRPDRRGLALQDAPGGACIFLAGRDCRVQPVKPQQCRDFPNGWNFPGFEKLCRALPREIGEEGAPSAPVATPNGVVARGS
jgi:Fe-S-cluster containining protein